MAKEPTKYRAPALDKGLDIIELLAAAPAALSIAEISEGVGRSRGEIFRMLQVLEERDYIARNEASRASKSDIERSVERKADDVLVG